VAFAAILLAPIVVVALNTPPFAARSQAQFAVGPGMLGPNAPAFMDTNGNNVPDGGDADIVPSRTGTAIRILGDPLDCDTSDSDDTLTLGGLSGGRYHRVSRNSDFNRSQSVNVDSSSGAVANGGSFVERNGGGTAIGSGNASLQDGNGDGAADSLVGGGSTNAGKNASFIMSLTTADSTGDGNPDFVSVPWGQANMLGVDQTDPCSVSGAHPQVWIPMADTNGDGRADAVVPDLDGDGNADSDLFRSPPLIAAAVPTTSPLWTIVLTVTLGSAALWMLRRREA
jgi:hypothetical protein